MGRPAQRQARNEGLALNGIEIRAAEPAEAASLSALAREAKASWGYAPEVLAAWTEQLSVSAEDIARRPTYVAVVEGEVAGFYALGPGHVQWSLEHLWVKPALLRRGVGRALLDHALDLALRSGAPCITIDSDPNAEGFYEAGGGLRFGEVAAPIAGDPERVRPQLVLNAWGGIPGPIETDRLVMRPPQAGDAAVIHASIVESLPRLRAFPASLQWAMEPPSVERTEGFCRAVLADCLRGRYLPMLCFLKENGEHVGNVSLHDINWQVPKAEVGFWGRTSYGGRGLMTEALNAIVDYAFEELGMRRIEALPDDRNEASCRMCERAGFELEGVLRNYRAWTDRMPRDARVYVRLR